MSATYKVKFTRASLDTLWPVTEFSDIIYNTYIANGENYSAILPIAMPWNNYPSVPGVIQYQIDIDAPALTTHPIHQLSEIEYIIQTKLSNTCLVEFDTIENLLNFITVSNSTWNLTSLTKQDFADWLIVNNQTVEEFSYNNGELIITPSIFK